MPWWKKKIPEIGGSILSRGSPGPRAENFDQLSHSGITVRRLPDQPECHWTLELTHRTWGQAHLISRRRPVFPTKDVLVFDRRLSDDERKAVLAAGTSIDLLFHPESDHVLTARKHFLRFLRAVSNSSAVAVVDHTAQSFWSMAELDRELEHDADVDIQALINLHMVQGDSGVRWVHTHGLASLGHCDLDVINPHEAVTGPAFDLIRAMAFAVVEGELVPQGASFHLASPGGDVRLLSTERLLREGTGIPPEWPNMVDDHHRVNHAVVCDPARGGLWPFKGKPRPSRFLSSPIDENLLIAFSTSASNLTAERARATYGVFRKFLDALRGLPLTAAVKMGYRMDGGGENDKEHLWFEAHATGDRTVEATLMNAPIHVRGLTQGARAHHDVDLMSDWMILTPFGPINPRQTALAPMLIARKDELIRAMKEGEGAAPKI